MAKLDCHIYGIPPSDEGHTHAHAHILLPLTNALMLEQDGKRHLLTPRHLGFVAPGVFHHCVCDADILMINIPDAMLRKSDVDMLAASVCLPLDADLIPLVELIKAEVAANPESNAVRYLYYYLYEKLVEAGSSKSQLYIKNHFSEDISIATLAQLENYNITYFTGWFKKRTGASPSGYIRQVRIEKAKELLASTDYRLLDIAIQVGYQTGASFTRAFKETEGCTPAEFRKASRLSGADTAV